MLTYTPARILVSYNWWIFLHVYLPPENLQKEVSSFGGDTATGSGGGFPSHALPEAAEPVPDGDTLGTDVLDRSGRPLLPLTQCWEGGQERRHSAPAHSSGTAGPWRHRPSGTKCPSVTEQ